MVLVDRANRKFRVFDPLSGAFTVKSIGRARFVKNMLGPITVSVGLSISLRDAM